MWFVFLIQDSRNQIMKVLKDRRIRHLNYVNKYIFLNIGPTRDVTIFQYEFVIVGDDRFWINFKF